MAGQETKRNLFSALAVYRQPAVLRMLVFGFSSGLPLLLVFGTLSFWMRESGVDLKTIGFMSWVGMCWAFKWCWAFLVDSLELGPLARRLGRRRSWLLLAQAGLVCSLSAMAMTDPAEHTAMMALFALLTAFFGATQDVVVDAYRIESGGENDQAAFAAAYQTGYRCAMIWAGAGALVIAAAAEGTAIGAWRCAYLVMAASVLVGVAATLLSPEPQRPTAGAAAAAPRTLGRWFYDSACRPFIDFFQRFGPWTLVLLLLIATYRISDYVMGVMSYAFYADLGFTKEEVAAVSKVFGVVMTLVGAFAGGAVVMYAGVMKTLFLGALLSSLTNLLFSVLAGRGHDMVFLVFTVSADNLAGGLASAAFVAYLSGLVNVHYSATQYAVLSSVMLLLPKFLAGFSGVMVESMGFADFFTLTAAMGIPVLVLVGLGGLARKKLAQRARQVTSPSGG